MKSKKAARIGILIALSVLGAQIKIPSMVGSLAFDAMPGFYAALTICPFTGALVAGFGHVATALTSGMPLGFPIHVLVAFGMMLAAFAAGAAARYNKLIGCAVGAVVNGLVLPAVFIAIPGFGLPFFTAATPSILAAAVLNVGVAFGLTHVPALRTLARGQ